MKSRNTYLPCFRAVGNGDSRKTPCHPVCELMAYAEFPEGAPLSWVPGITAGEL